MRNLSSAALLKIANNIGNEPVNIIEVEWVRDSGNKFSYADRDLTAIQGKILEVSDLDNVINVSGSTDSQEITVKLDDVDGTIRGIMDENDIHFRDVWVYQWFEGLDLSDKFLLFKGKINSPVIWNEGDRTVTFTIITQLESREIGFSPEEGNFIDMTPELTGQPWPMCFGTVQHVRALRLTGSATGTLGDGIGIADFALEARSAALGLISAYRREKWGTHIDQSDAALATYLCQVKTQRNSFRVFNRKVFPNGTIDLKIGKATLRGHFVGATNQFVLDNTGDNYKLNHPEFSKFTTMFYDLLGRSNIFNRINTGCDGGTDFFGFNPGRLFLISQVFKYQCGGDCDGDKSKVIPHAEGWSPYTRPFEVVQRVPGGNYTGIVVGDNAGYVYLQTGSKVKLAENESQKFIVSIVPGTVLRVSAWAQREGQKFLQDVPANYYTVTNETWGEITAVVVTLDESLSKYEGIGWSDDIFVTFESDIGPNTVDIIEYLINRYTDLTVDTDSFDRVRSRVDVYEAHFAIYDRKDILTVLQEISYQACCSLILKNDVFYIKYLPEEPTPVSTIGKGDILVDSLTIGHTNTDDIITKMVCEWKSSDAQEEPYKTILRHNVAKYGTHTEEFDYYIYNYIDAVIKSATFWTIRRSNVWKKAQFSTPLTKLNLESLDDISINLVGDLANVPVTCSIESAFYNSADRTLEFDCWTPVKAGTMEPYIFAYPADVDSTLTFPTVEEIQNGFNGSGFQENQSATGRLLPHGVLLRRETFTTIGPPITLGNPCDPLVFRLPTDDECEEEEDEEPEEDEEGDKNDDEGKRNPSDLGDEKLPGEVIQNEFLSDDIEGPASIDFKGEGIPQPDGYGNDNGVSSGLKSGDIDGDETDDLPDPDDIEDDACNWLVVAGQMTPVSSVRPAGCGGFEISGAGGVSGCVVNGNYIANVYIFVFNSQSAAEAKAVAINDNTTGTVGENLIWSASIIPGLGSCQEPDDPQMVAYRGP